MLKFPLISPRIGGFFVGMKGIGDRRHRPQIEPVGYISMVDFDPADKEASAPVSKEEIMRRVRKEEQAFIEKRTNMQAECDALMHGDQAPIHGERG